MYNLVKPVATHDFASLFELDEFQTKNSLLELIEEGLLEVGQSC